MKNSKDNLKKLLKNSIEKKQLEKNCPELEVVYEAFNIFKKPKIEIDKNDIEIKEESDDEKVVDAKSLLGQIAQLQQGKTLNQNIQPGNGPIKGNFRPY